MGERLSIGPFVAEDSFLRHVDRRRHIKNGTISWEVFRERAGEDALSFTYQDENLRVEAGLHQYQRDKRLLYGDLPGLCRLTFRDLTESLEPPLPPRWDPAREDEKYGHLHCCTDLPRDHKHRVQMAHLAECNRIVCDFIPRKKRKDRRVPDSNHS